VSQRYTNYWDAVGIRRKDETFKHKNYKNTDTSTKKLKQKNDCALSIQTSFESESDGGNY